MARVAEAIGLDRPINADWIAGLHHDFVGGIVWIEAFGSVRDDARPN